MTSIKNKMAYWVKYCKPLYRAYFIVGNVILRILRTFIKVDEHLILFVSFGGRKYDDSPRCIYESMITDKRFEGYRLVWAFHSPDKIREIPASDKVQMDSLQFFVTALKARVWVTNSSVERGLSFKQEGTIHFNTWHGTPLKKIGRDVPSQSKSFRSAAGAPYDVFLAQGEYEADIFSRVFSIGKEHIYTIGLPRNDNLSGKSGEYREALRTKLGLPLQKKLILYAPTFREYELSSLSGKAFQLPFNLSYWKKTLSEDYVILYRAHYEVAQKIEGLHSDFLINMSSYPHLEDLMQVSDMLISDYSSIFFDYSILGKPMICFAYDFERYTAERGLYFDIRQVIPAASNDEELVAMIQSQSENVSCCCVKDFQKKYVTAFGNATMQSLDIIHDLLVKH